METAVSDHDTGFRSFPSILVFHSFIFLVGDIAGNGRNLEV